MYKNAGAKVKGLATTIAVIMMVIFGFAGLITMFENFFVGLVTILVGCLSAWLSGLMLAAFFMATDYVTSPVTPRGRLLYGAICGGITVLIRYCGAYPEGASFAILIGNLLVHYIDRFTKPKPFGKGRRTV